MSKNFFSLVCLVVVCLASDRALAAEKLISGVPNYDQDIFPIDQTYASIERGDCVPIACTMINGYYDANGWPRLIPYGGNSVINTTQPYSGNAWGVDTVVRKYKQELGYNGSSTIFIPIWDTIIQNN